MQETRAAPAAYPRGTGKGQHQAVMATEETQIQARAPYQQSTPCSPPQPPTAPLANHMQGWAGLRGSSHLVTRAEMMSVMVALTSASISSTGPGMGSCWQRCSALRICCLFCQMISANFSHLPQSRGQREGQQFHPIPQDTGGKAPSLGPDPQDRAPPPPKKASHPSHPSCALSRAEAPCLPETQTHTRGVTLNDPTSPSLTLHPGPAPLPKTVTPVPGRGQGWGHQVCVGSQNHGEISLATGPGKPPTHGNTGAE